MYIDIFLLTTYVDTRLLCFYRVLDFSEATACAWPSPRVSLALASWHSLSRWYFFLLRVALIFLRSASSPGIFWPPSSSLIFQRRTPWSSPAAWRFFFLSTLSLSLVFFTDSAHLPAEQLLCAAVFRRSLFPVILSAVVGLIPCTAQARGRESRRPVDFFSHRGIKIACAFGLCGRRRFSLASTLPARPPSQLVLQPFSSSSRAPCISLWPTLSS